MLRSRNNFPPGGFPYFEPALNWRSPRDGAPFNLRVAQIQAVRAANPSSTLNPSFEACADALDAFTCARLANDPAWCIPATDPVALAAAEAARPRPCGGCGSRRRRS